MIRSALFAALIFALPPSAAAQTAPQAPQERLRLADEADTGATFSGTPYDAGNGHLRMWSWTFDLQTSTAGGASFNTLATLHEFDCQARSLSYIRVEAYLDNVYLLGEEAGTPFEVADPGTISEIVLDMACNEPLTGDYVDTPVEARALVTQYVGPQ